MVRIEPKASWLLAIGSVGFSLSGVLLLIYPPHGDDIFSRIAEALTPYIQIFSILFGLAAAHRYIGLALQRTAIIAADASGLSIDGGATIPWAEVIAIEPYEYRMQGTHRGLLVKLRDRKALDRRQLGSFWTRNARRGTPGDIFIPDKIFAMPLLDAVAALHGERPR